MNPKIKGINAKIKLPDTPLNSRDNLNHFPLIGKLFPAAQSFFRLILR